MAKSAKSSDKSQVDKFREAARELETDESEARFDGVLKRVANAPGKAAKKPAEKKASQKRQ